MAVSPSNCSRPIPRIKVRAFSLVEVAMALGVFAFAILGLVGLIPVAVNTHREAKQDTVLSQITQRLSAEVLLTDVQLLSDLDGFERAFDAEGREVASSDPLAVYRAKILLVGYQAPGASSPSDSLQRAVFYAVHDPGNTKIGSSPASGSLIISRASANFASGSAAL